MQDCPFPTEPCVLVRLDIWEKGNISLLQLSEKLCGALRHALCDAVMEFLVLPAPLCVEAICPLGAMDLEELSSAGESPARTATPAPSQPAGAQLCWGNSGWWGWEGGSCSPLCKLCCVMSQGRSITGLEDIFKGLSASQD